MSKINSVTVQSSPELSHTHPSPCPNRLYLNVKSIARSQTHVCIVENLFSVFLWSFASMGAIPWNTCDLKYLGLGKKMEWPGSQLSFLSENPSLQCELVCDLLGEVTSSRCQSSKHLSIPMFKMSQKVTRKTLHPNCVLIYLWHITFVIIISQWCELWTWDAAPVFWELAI